MAPSTLRRYLAELERRGLLIRTHGGAVSIDSGRDEPIYKKTSQNVSEKLAIAAAALPLTAGAHVVALGGGSTVLTFARRLAQEGHCAIYLTDSAPLALELAQESSPFEVRLCGGTLRGRTGCLVGEEAVRFFDREIDVAFIGADALDPSLGVFSQNIREAQVERAMAKAAKRTYVLCDHTKLGRSGLTQVALISDVVGVVTGRQADGDVLLLMRRAGLELILA